MKGVIKVIVAIIIMTFALQTKGQQWQFLTLPSDELLDQEAMDAAIYDTDDYTCVISFTHNCIMVTSKNGIFDYHKREYYVHVGLYDKEGNLVEKHKQFCYGNWPVDYSIFKFTNPDSFFGRNRPKVVDLVIGWLSEADGYVRIVAPRFQKTNLEIILPCDQKFKEKTNATENK